MNNQNNVLDLMKADYKELKTYIANEIYDNDKLNILNREKQVAKIKQSLEDKPHKVLRSLDRSARLYRSSQMEWFAFIREKIEEMMRLKSRISNYLNEDLSRTYLKAQALEEIADALNTSYEDVYNEKTNTTSFDVLNHKHFAEEVEKILKSYGFNKVTEV
ncbi:hypothetical protein MHZ36_12675 [Staphylococcus sp. ACRSN]|uniref:hypothetical protein n=1 Tax=Staphylococcus sp. ACRSN TaxID=2918214 RepID=UPI001EF28135|nr:hypothetical protein [Staphylococcus sp. ACRSN]MCG7340143.1 hypothetical protein [Staphylococcus sp. ACRSN]